ncbi:MAG: shikimate dehydrogenase [Parvularculaceae bacterium]
MSSHANTPILAGVAGWPVGHSLSPLIHNTWAARAGVPGHYVPLAVEPFYESFARAMDAARTLGFKGVNVTIPHKEHALRYAGQASDRAKAAGAANMLTFAGEGAVADNTDILGFSAAVREQSSVPGRTALVLGAGGAARGIILALKDLGVEEIFIANRTHKKAQELAETFGGVAINWERREEALAAIDLLVNTTSLGMTGEPPLELPLTELRLGAIVADIVYSPLETRLLKEAAAKGAKTVDGLAMLMHQAVPAFEAWFGAKADADAHLRALLVSALKTRGRS